MGGRRRQVTNTYFPICVLWTTVRGELMPWGSYTAQPEVQWQSHWALSADLFAHAHRLSTATLSLPSKARVNGHWQRHGHLPTVGVTTDARNNQKKTWPLKRQWFLTASTKVHHSAHASGGSRCMRSVGHMVHRLRRQLCAPCLQGPQSTWWALAYGANKIALLQTLHESRSQYRELQMSCFEAPYCHDHSATV